MSRAIVLIGDTILVRNPETGEEVEYEMSTPDKNGHRQLTPAIEDGFYYTDSFVDGHDLEMGGRIYRRKAGRWLELSQHADKKSKWIPAPAPVHPVRQLVPGRPVIYTDGKKVTR